MRRAADAAVAAAVVIAAVALGRLFTDHVPVRTVADEPFERSGSVGEAVALEYARVSVDGVRAADTLISTSSQVPSAGTFLITDVQLRATRESTVLFAHLEDGSGVDHYPTGRAGCPKNVTTSTGVDSYAMFCFEVTRDALEGATLVVARGAPGESGAFVRRDDVARIDLGIDAERAGELWDAEETHRAVLEKQMEPLDTEPVPEDAS